MGNALIKAKEEGLDPFQTIESIIDWSSFVSSVQEAQNLTRPSDYDYLDLLEKRFFFLRRYTPTLLKSLEFHSTKSNEPLLEAINILHNLNETSKRKVPIDSPIDFISKRWKKHLYDIDGSINRHYYEMAVLTELREHVRAGNISIVCSKQYRDFEDYLLSKEEWIKSKDNTRLSVSINFEEYLKESTINKLKTKYGEDLVHNGVNIMCNNSKQGKITAPVKYLTGILENLNNKPSGNEALKFKKLGFNNFESREYDYVDLERKLLGWDK